MFYDLPCTDLGDHNVVFGGEDALKEGLIETYNRYRPELIVVITTCTSDLIGDNVAGVVREVQASGEVGCRVIYSSGDSVGMAKRVGAQDLFYAIVEQFLADQPVPERPSPCVNLIPNCDDRARMKTDEMVSILGKMGIGVNRIYFDNTRVSDLYDLPRANLNVFLLPSPMIWGDLAEKKWGMPYYVIAPTHELKDPEMINPYGIEGSAKVFMDIAGYLGMEQTAANVIRDLKEDAIERLEVLKKELAGKKVAITGGFNFHGMGLLVVRDLRMNACALVYRTQRNEHHQMSKDALREKIRLDAAAARNYGSDPVVLLNPEADEEIRAIKAAGTELVICSTEEAFRYHLAGMKTYSTFDFRHNHGRVGFESTLDLAAELRAALDRPPRESLLLNMLDYDSLNPHLTRRSAKFQDLFGITREGEKGGVFHDYL
jgi:nitrogenase molybdenum-iron protein alpha/beta subunit